MNKLIFYYPKSRFIRVGNMLVFLSACYNNVFLNTGMGVCEPVVNNGLSVRYTQSLPLDVRFLK